MATYMDDIGPYIEYMGTYMDYIFICFLLCEKGYRGAVA